MIEDGFLEPAEDDIRPSMVIGLQETIDFAVGEATPVLP
jgi:hypothetical protein